MLKNEKPKAEFDFEKKLKTSTKVYFKSAVASDAAAPEKSPNVTITTDSKYVYLHSENEGLMKIGTGLNYTMLGKVYVHKPEYRLKERASLAFIHGRLFYRSQRIAPLALIELNPDTLDEINGNVNFDNQVPNCLFPEMTSPDIEFPHPPVDAEVKTKAKEMTANAASNREKTNNETGQTGTSTTANPQKRDIRLMRPPQRSPIFTEGRYLYVVSQWTVEARTRTNEEEDEEEEGGESSTQSDLRQAKYGVDIYDPLQEFEHIRSVELVDTLNTIKDGTTGKTKQKPPLNIKCLDQASFATNGSELVMAIPPNVEEGNEIKYKYFSLKDGKMLRANPIKEPFYFTTLSYDYNNNVVYGVNDTKKSFDNFSIYTNSTIPEKFGYNEDSEFYFPYENDKIVDIALEGLGFSEEEDRNKEKQEKIKEDWQVLLNLGFTNKDYPGMSLGELGAITQNKEQKVHASQAMQLFILANISRLGDYYANLLHNKSKDLDSIDNFRRPYCVSLLPKVFDYLQQFLEHYSKSFFIDEKDFTSDSIFDQCSLLCVLRIIKYNLANAENLSNHLKKMNVALPKKEFLKLLQKLIDRIIESSKEVVQNRDFDEIRKSIYQESLNIMRYNLSFIYEDSMEAILRDLRKNLENLDRKQERDLILPIFGWLKEPNHIASLVSEILNDQNTQREDLVKELSKLIDFIITCEVKAFCKYVQNVDDYEKFPAYNVDDFIVEAMSFLLEFQKELLFQVGQKVQDKTLELGPIFILSSNFTESITRHAVSINEAFEQKIKDLAKKVEANVKGKAREKEEEEEKKAGPKEEEITEKKEVEPPKKSGKEKKKSENEIIADINNKIWEDFTKIFNFKVYFSQILTVQVNTLTLLASNFLIAAKTLKHISTYLSSLNNLYAARKEIHSSTLEKVSTFLKEKSETLESEHPPANKVDKKEKVQILGAKSLRIVFDPQCDLKKNCQYIQFFSDDKYKDKITEKLDKTGEVSSFPKEELVIEGDTVYFLFHTDNCRLPNWGYKFTVYASIQDIQESDWMAGFHRTSCWLASKCAAQLINGSALQQALLQDEEQRYNNLLNSKLFSGGIEKCYFSGGKEAIWIQLSDIINEFEAGFLNEYLGSSMTPEERQEEEFFNHIINGNSNEKVTKLLDYIQKQFSKECLWASLGGENGAKIVRAAFAVIIKHAGLMVQFQETVDEVDEIVTQNRVDATLKNFIKKWHAASRMRTWLVEKRKEIDEIAERNRQTAASAKNSNLAKSSSSAAPVKKEKKEDKKKLSKRKKPAKKEAEITFQDTKPQENPAGDEESQPQVQLQVRDTEEIIQRMIEQIVKKAQFLIQLIPAKHWSQDQFEKKEKQLLFRASSEVEELSNKEEEWKRRLLQWKSVRQSKGVFKSLEDESKEIHSSLTTSVLQCLQSPVSIRRLKKQVESSYLRAICRTIGLNALTQILLGCRGSLFRQDIVGWLCSSLRGNENKLYHFTDNLQGCGHFLESAINTAFKNVIQAAVKSMINSDWADEIKCMLESLKWKFHGDDHAFLAEIDLFGILRGVDAKSLLRRAWGRSLNTSFDGFFLQIKTSYTNKMDSPLVKKLLELFEIIVILCVGKLQSKHNVNLAEALSSGSGGPSLSKKDKMPQLERHVSAIDEYSAEILIRQAFSVIFTELKEADNNYRSFSGLDWGAWQRTLLRKEKKDEEEKKKKKGKKPGEAASPGMNEDGLFGEEDLGEGGDDGSDEGSRSRNLEEEEDKNEGEDNQEEEVEEDEFYEEAIEENEKEEEKFEGEIEEEIKEDYSLDDSIGAIVTPSQTALKPVTAKKDNKEKKEDKEEGNEESKRKKKNEKIKEAIHKEEKRLLDLINQIYNPEFLYRLLQLLYKCAALGLDQVSIVVGNPKYLAILYSLLRSGPPNHKMLITKILTIVFQTLPFELFADSVSDLLKNSKEPVEQILLHADDKNIQGNTLILDYLMKIIFDIRRRSFTENIDYPEDYSVSCELICFFRTLLSHNSWSKTVGDYLKNYLLKSSDNIQKALALSILGGEINGLRYSGKIRICSTDVDELFNDNVLLKQKLEDSKESAIVLGFSENYKEKISDEDKKKFKEDDDPRFNIKMNMGSIIEGRNPAVLIYSSLAKEITNLSTIELSTVNRFNVFAIDSKEFEPTKFPIEENLLNVFKWALEKDLQKNVIESTSIYMKALSLKSLHNYLEENPENINSFITNQKDLLKNLLEYANQQVITGDNLMSLELTEERLYRLLASSAQSDLDLSDLKRVTITIKNFELEAQFGKEFSNKKYPIQSGYNLEKIGQYYELIPLSEAKGLDKKTLNTKAVLISLKDWTEELHEWAALCKIVITYGFDLQKLQENIEGSGTHGRKAGTKTIPLKKKKSNKDDKEPPKLKKNKSLVSRKQEKGVLPGCIVNISERYFNELRNEYNNQGTKSFKNIFHEKRLVDELIEFGFPKEVVEEYFFENSKSSIEVMINEISKMIEQKDEEKAKLGGQPEAEVEEPIVEPKANEEDLPNENLKDAEEEAPEAELIMEDAEKEEANSCFKCKGEKEQNNINDEKNRLYDNSIEFEGLNRIGKIILFKQTNYNFSIYHARRAMLTLLHNWNSNLESLFFENTDKLLRFMKLICFEAIYSSAIFCNNTLINQMKSLLLKFFELQKTNKKVADFLDVIFEKCIVEPISELQKKYLVQGSEKHNAEKASGFTGRINNECEIDAPFLDFSLWLAHIFFNSQNEEVSGKLLRLDLLYTILGLLTVLRQNKSLGWGMIVFSLDYLEFLKQNLKKLLKADPTIFNLFNQEYIIRLHNYLYNLRSREKIEAHSRKTQMITEILINLNGLHRSLEKQELDETMVPVKICDTRLDLDKFKTIDNVTDVVEMMQNYQENKILLASTWLQTSGELIKKEQKSIDGDHFYYKNLHTFKVTMPFTTEASIKFSEDSQTDLGDSVLFSSDVKGENSLQKMGGNLSKKTVIFPAGTFYVHFPAKGSDIFTFGANESAQLGNGDTNGNGPFCLEQFSSANVVSIDGNDNHMMIMNKSGELWSCGSGSQTGIASGSTRVLSKVPCKDKVRSMSCGSNFSIFVTENNEMFGVGSNTDGRFGLNWNNGTATPQKIEFSFSKVIKQVSCGTNHSMILTSESQVYCTGSNEFGQLGLVDENGNKSANVNTFRIVTEIAKKKAIHICAGMYVSFIVIKEKDKSTTVMSCGEKANGKLGLGSDAQNNVINFTTINELKNVDVKMVSCKKKHCLALTGSGKIYAWGLNEHGQLGTGNFENEFKPKLIPFFENMKAISCGAGNHHSVVVAKTKNDDHAKVYAFGENTSNRLGLKAGKEKINLPQHVEFYDEKAPYSVIVASNHSIIMTENMKIPKYRDQHRVACNTCQSNPINGNRIIVPVNGQLENYCYPCFLKLSPVPALSLCVKEAMNQTKEFTWPIIEKAETYLEAKWADENNKEFIGSSCKNCKTSPIKDVLYSSMHEKDSTYTVCEKCMGDILENQVSSTIYYRIERPLKGKNVLPIFSRNYFFINSDTYGYNITITPKFSEKGHDYMIEKYKESFKSFSDDFLNLKPETDEQIVDLINNIAQKKEKSAFDLDDNVNFPKEELNIRTAIDKCSIDFLRKRFLILKNFNSRIKTILPYIDFSAKKDQNRLRNVYSNASIYIFWDVKSDLFEKILAADAKAGTNMKIKVNRMKANKFIQKGKPDHTGEFTVFGQIFQYFKNTGFSSFKCTKETNPFSVQFVGEAAIDVGGPYREAISQMCTELQSGALPLLIPSPNQKNDSGQFREKWVLNPGANTLIHMVHIFF